MRRARTARDILKSGRLERRLPGELVLRRWDYARREWSRSAVEKLSRLIRQRVPWHTPLVADPANHLLDGWRRYKAYRLVYPADRLRVEVEVLIVDCEPHELLLIGAKLNRVHGERLPDEDAAEVAAQCALRMGPRDEREMRRKARRFARELQVAVELVPARLPGAAPRKAPRPVPPTPRPAPVFDRAAFTQENFRLHYAWVADPPRSAARGNGGPGDRGGGEEGPRGPLLYPVRSCSAAAAV